MKGKTKTERQQARKLERRKEAKRKAKVQHRPSGGDRSPFRRSVAQARNWVTPQTFPATTGNFTFQQPSTFTVATTTGSTTYDGNNLVNLVNSAGGE